MKLLAISAALLLSGAALGQTYTATPENLPLAVNGELGASDALFRERRLDIYEVELVADGKLVVEATSSAFDPYLYLLERSSGQLHENDDANGTDAKLTLELPAGKHWIGVSSASGSGRYSLSASVVGTTIYFVTDPALIAALPAELATFMNDVAADTGARPVLVPVPASAAALRQRLRDGWVHDGLRGAFFIGAVPLVKEHNVPSLDPQLSDNYYRSLDCPYPEADAAGIVKGSPWFTTRTRCRASIWTSRIRPYMPGSAGIEQVRSYLEKNHRLRNSETQYSDEMIFQAALPRDITTDYQRFVNENFADHPLYSPDEVTVIQQTQTQAQKQSFKAAMQTNAELLTINVHGSAQLIQFQGTAADDPALNMFVDEFRDLAIGPKVIEFMSCSVGDPTVTSIASSVLFNSDALLVEAAYTNVIMSTVYFEELFNSRFRALGLGQSFADTQINTEPSTAMNYLGDPTVRLARRDTTAPAPVMKINGRRLQHPFQIPIDVGTVAGTGSTRTPFVIENTGTAPLKIQSPTELGVAVGVSIEKDGKPGFRLSDGFVFMLDPTDSNKGSNGYEVVIAPGETRALHMVFRPSADVDARDNVHYSAFLPLTTNDPAVGNLLLLPSGNLANAAEPLLSSPGMASDGSVTTAMFGGGASLDEWHTQADAIPSSASVDIGGVVTVDERHVGQKGAFYVWARVEGLGWYYQDTAGQMRFAGKDYEPAADPARVRVSGVTLPAKQIGRVLSDFSFRGRGLEGRDIELVFGYSVDGSPVLYRNVEPIRFIVQ
jgi:hypothetical protein